MMTNTHTTPVQAIGRLLVEAMDAAVSNGANSASMPDHLVEIAAWIAGCRQADAGTPMSHAEAAAAIGINAAIHRITHGDAQGALEPLREAARALSAAPASAPAEIDPSRILADPERRDAALKDEMLAAIWRNRVAGLIEEFATDAAARYLADRIVSELYDVPFCDAPRPQADAGTTPTVKYVPVASNLPVRHGRHPNDDEPRTDACRAALSARGDDDGQGLDPYWKWGFAAGFNAATAAAPDWTTGSWVRTEEVDRLARQIDVALYGSAASEQAQLCDLAALVTRSAAKAGRPLLALPTGLPVGQEPKYSINRTHLVNRVTGEVVPHDEPVFVFRARDAMAVRALEGYFALIADREPTGNHADAVRERIADFRTFAAHHPERMKWPDTSASAVRPNTSPLRRSKADAKADAAAIRAPAAVASAQEVIWPKAKDVGRIGDMSPTAHMRVGLDNDNDVNVSVWGEDGGGSVEFCTPGSGGGKSSRTRTALLALMVAMEADNAEDPGRDWWARRMGGAKKEGGSA